MLNEAELHSHYLDSKVHVSARKLTKGRLYTVINKGAKAVIRLVPFPLYLKGGYWYLKG